MNVPVHIRKCGVCAGRAAKQLASVGRSDVNASVSRTVFRLHLFTSLLRCRWRQMLSRAVCLLAIAAVCVPTASASSYAGTYFPEITVPADVTCDTCQAVVAVAGDLISNTTTLQQLVNLTEWGCAAAFATDSTLLAVCDIVADLVVDKLLPAIDKGVTSLAWTPLAFCATVRAQPQRCMSAQPVVRVSCDDWLVC